MQMLVHAFFMLIGNSSKWNSYQTPDTKSKVMLLFFFLPLLLFAFSLPGMGPQENSMSYKQFAQENRIHPVGHLRESVSFES